MTPLLLGLFAASLCCDVCGQLCFKLGANRLGEDQHGLFAHIRQVICTPWMSIGILVYAIEVLVWLAILERAPLSLAFPIASLNFCGVVIAGKMLLGEHVSRKRWISVVLITLGVIIIGLGGGE